MLTSTEDLRIRMGVIKVPRIIIANAMNDSYEWRDNSNLQSRTSPKKYTPRYFGMELHIVYVA